jgi:hypothetical protein
MQKWEYKIINKNDYVRLNQQEDQILERLFNQLGEQGWELVSVYGAVVFYFKRMKKGVDW